MKKTLIALALTAGATFTDVVLEDIDYTVPSTPVATVSFAWGMWILVRTLIFGQDIPGYPSLIVAVTFLGGLQLIGIGIVGEYVGRTYIESKRRPPFVVRRVYRPGTEPGSGRS